MISGLACQNSGAEAQHWFECYTSNELYVYLPAPIEWSSIICRYNNIIAQDNTENEIGVPGVPRLPYDEIISHPVCNLVIQYSARSSEGSHKLIGNLIHRWMASMSRRFKIFLGILDVDVVSRWRLLNSADFMRDWKDGEMDHTGPDRA